MKRTAIAAAVLILGAACGASPESAEQPNTGTSTSAATAAATSPTTAPTALAASVGGSAPWSAPPQSETEVPAVLVEQWNRAGNKDWCSALYPADVAVLGSDGAIRSASFAGGWAVAWDLPSGPGRLASGEYCDDCGRGAYGIAGLGLHAGGNEPARWPTVVGYDDGSMLGYGFEGDSTSDSGAPLLADLLIQDEGCVYNVWSFLGEDHLRTMVSELRKVAGLEGEPTLWLSQLPAPETQALGDPPWGRDELAADVVPTIADDEWAEAGSPSSCPMLYFADLGDAADATIRPAAHEGEMLVAWDLPDGPGHGGDGLPCEDCGRGVIGLGTFQHSSYEGPVAYTWSDGSEASLRTGLSSYGVEAFVSVAGFDCDYWVWSHLGVEHLEYLLGQLRRVEGAV